MTPQEKKLREVLENQKSAGFLITDQVWFQFRDGRNPPKVSPWGAILWTLNSTQSGNFLIPGKGVWFSSVRDYLEVSDRWLETFMSAFDNKPQENLTAELEEAQSIALNLRSEYISSSN